MTDPKVKETSPAALARYIATAVESAEEDGKNAIMVLMPKAFALPLWEARQIVDALNAAAERDALLAEVAALKVRLGEAEAALDGFRVVCVPPAPPRDEVQP